MAFESRGFRVYAVVAGLAAAAALVVTAARSGAPSAPGLLLFCGLVIYSSNRSVEFADGSFVNADFMIMLAAVVAFHDSSLVAPAIVGLARALDVDHLRRRAWTLIVLNAASGIAGVVAAGAVLELVRPANDSPALPAFIAAVPTALVCVVALWAVLAPAFLLRGQQLQVLVGTFAPRAAESLPFSLLGFFLGRMYLTLGAPAVLMLIVPIFIAREMFASYMKVKESHDETVAMLIRALETKDFYTAGHSERVARYAAYMGKEFSFGPARMERLRCAALMHDIGKLVVPNQLLNKPGKLTEEEFTRVRMHEGVSVRMLSHIDFLRPVAGHTDGEQMRFDPDDPDHPIEPYMVMIADAYDAMTSTRSYRKALPQEVAFQELRDKSGAQFHPECVEALIRALEKRGEIHGAGHEEKSEFENAPEAGLGSAGLGDLLPSET